MKMNKWKSLVSLLWVPIAVLTLSSCGGHSGSSFAGSAASQSSSSTPTQKVATVTVLSDSAQIPSDNTTPATITALVRDTNNVVIPNEVVAFRSDSGLLAVTQATTDANGEAKATLSTPGDYRDRTINVTASVGTVSANVPVNVVGTTLTLSPQSGSPNITQNATASYTLTLLDSNEIGIPNQTVTISSAKGNTLSSNNLTTDQNGHASFTVTGTVSGTDTLTASAAGQTATQSLVVSSQNFVMSTPAANALIALNTPTNVTVVWTNNGSPQANQQITFTTTRGTFGGAISTTAMTDSTGTATVSISSTSAGPATISATATGVTAQATVTFIATNPASITVQASPDTIATNAQSTIYAVVRDAQGNLVDGQTVDFQLTDVTGGSISLASAVTNTQGVATTVYTASNTASAANGVQITASVQNTTISGSVTLTVGGQTVFLSLGTGATISENNNKTQFIMPWSVQAVDARGNALPNVPIALTIHSSYPNDVPGGNTYAYFKGIWTAGASAWQQTVNASCLNEDTNENGILDPGEDINGNGRLDPGDVATASPGSLTTDSTGTAEFNVIYPEDHALWVQVTLTATATVNGTQNSTKTVFVLPMLASYINNVKAGIPGDPDPYGSANACTSPN
jgi:hypothetical protein